MGLFGRARGTKLESPKDEAIAHSGSFSEARPYAKSLSSECGVVFEDDGETGYFYATDGTQSQVLDAVLVYDSTVGTKPQPGEQFFFVWNPLRQRVGLFYAGQFQAAFDFAARRGASLTGQPAKAPSGSAWSPEGHEWDDSLIAGIEP